MHIQDTVRFSEGYREFSGKTTKPHWRVGFGHAISALEKCTDDMKPEEIQTEIYTVGKNSGYKENLREWFKLIYEVIFGVENGPRLGFFISFFGRKEMITLIKEKIHNV